jgi:hypothetical protein
MGLDVDSYPAGMQYTRITLFFYLVFFYLVFSIEHFIEFFLMENCLPFQ